MQLPNEVESIVAVISGAEVHPDLMRISHPGNFAHNAFANHLSQQIEGITDYTVIHNGILSIIRINAFKTNLIQMQYRYQ